MLKVILICFFAFTVLFSGNSFSFQRSFIDGDPKTYSPEDEYHFEILKYFEGKWSQDYSYWVYPGAEPFQEKGNTDNKVILDKRYLQMVSVTHQVIGGSVYTLQIIGYNTKEKNYYTYDTDEQGANLITATGDYDAAKDMFIMKGNEKAAREGAKRNFEYITRLVNNDQYVCELYYNLPDGSKFKAMEVVNNRVK